MADDIDILLGRAAHYLASGEVEQAFLIYTDLFKLHASNPLVCIGLGKSLCAKGETEKAVQLIDDFINSHTEYSTNPELYFVKGYALEGKALWLEAIKCYESCIYLDPKHFDALYNQGNIYLEMGKYSEALVRYGIAIGLNPNHARLLNNAGIACVKSDQFDRGIFYFEAALKLDPHFADGLANKAWTLLSLRRADEALEQFRKLIDLGERLESKLTVIDAYKGCGLAQIEVNSNMDALDSFSTAIGLDPSNPELLNNRGNVYKYLDQWSLAISDFQQALALRMDYAEAHSNLGNVFKELANFQQALHHYSLAIELKPGFAQAHLNKALILLGQGSFEAGFQEYEWRWATPEYASQVLQTTKPLWEHSSALDSKIDPSLKTSSLHSKRLLVWNEQGVGDDIYFVRFLPLIRALVKHLIVRVDERLVGILSRSFTDIQFVAESQSLMESEYDVHIPIGNLAQIGCTWSNFEQLNNEIKNPQPNTLVPAQLRTPYLICPPSEVAKTRSALMGRLSLGGGSVIQQFTSTKTDFVIGVSWKSLHPQSGAKRSIALVDLLRSFHTGFDELQINESQVKETSSFKRLHWVSLQYSDVFDEIKSAANLSGLQVHTVNGLDAERDLDGLASAMCACDLVITIDNTTAHLAGALGLNTWVLLPLTSDWRWQVTEDVVYGYPTAKIYRQRIVNEWDAPLGEMAAALMELLTISK